MIIFFKTLTGEKLSIDIAKSETIRDVREKIAKKLDTLPELVHIINNEAPLNREITELLPDSMDPYGDENYNGLHKCTIGGHIVIKQIKKEDSDLRGVRS